MDDAANPARPAPAGSSHPPAPDPPHARHDPSRPPTLFERTLYRVVRWLIVWFCRLYWRLEVHGLDHVPDGAFVLSGVHRSYIDTPLVSAVTRRRMRYMGKQEMWKLAPAARFFTAMGGFPVNRGAADREALRTCQAVLRAGEPVVMFPEGTRRTGPVVEDLFEGPAFVAGRTGAPIVPVGIGGSEAAMAPGSRMIRPVKIALVIGAPIPAPVGVDGKRPTRRQVAETTERLRVALQDLFDEAQAVVGVPNPPRR